MERETSEFSKWLLAFEKMASDLELLDALDAVALIAYKDFGIRLWFVEVLGRRWSYMAGEMPEHPPQSDIQRIELERDIGLVSDTWEKLPEDDRAGLVEFLNRLISERRVVSRK